MDNSAFTMSKPSESQLFENPHGRIFSIQTDITPPNSPPTHDTHRFLGSALQRAGLLNTVFTPPESPTREKSEILAFGHIKSVNMQNNDSITPPASPSMIPMLSLPADKPKRCDSVAGSDVGVLSTISDSVSEKEETTDTMVFPYWNTDYEGGGGGKKGKKLGEGAWSDVYLALPCEPQLPNPTASPTIDHNIPSETQPAAYALKTPASRSARGVLAAEAKMLTYLSRRPESSSHITPFYGLDERNGALVLKAMDNTLDGWLEKELNPLSEPARTEKLAVAFPNIASKLIDGLDWLEKQGCVHGDIKPGNVLLSTAPQLDVVYSDFSSAIIPALSSDDGKSAPLGGGTWDYLDPVLLDRPIPGAPLPSPTSGSDLWSLAITLLYVVIGASPLDGIGANKFIRRDCVKHGTPMVYAGYGDKGAQNMKRLTDLGKALGFDVKSWLAGVLKKDPEDRVHIGQWKQALLDGVQKKSTRHDSVL